LAVVKTVPDVVGNVSVAPPLVMVLIAGLVSVTPETILEEPTDAGLFGIAFNTELTRKLSVTTLSPTVQALFRTTVVPVVAV
jgi:hypothetical protein